MSYRAFDPFFFDSRPLLLALAGVTTIRTMELDTIRSCTLQPSAVTYLGLELVESFLPSSAVGFSSDGDGYLTSA